MVGCQCPVPVEKSWQAGSCRQCGKLIPREIVATTEKLQAFFDRAQIPANLADGCHAREQVGRKHFGLEYLGRDNVQEFLEEMADGVNYLAFQTLCDIRGGAAESDPALIEAAYYLGEAFKAVGRRG